jgi:hypothetical protein
MVASHELVQRCTVRVEKAGRHLGTGFFVAPGRVLTCAHVVAWTLAAGETVSVRWGGVAYDVTEHRLGPEHPVSRQVDVYPWPDLAVLTIGLDEHPCVPLTREAPEPGKPLWSVGYTDQFRKGVVQLIPVGLTFEGAVVLDAAWQEGVAAGGAAEPVHKLAIGQVVGGMSGSAVLNPASGEVCGVLKRSRSVQTDAGGYAIPVAAAFDVDGPLEASTTSYWQQQHRAVLEARARGGELFDTVVELLPEGVAGRTLKRLAAVGVPTPPRPDGTDDPTWLATVLFLLDFGWLVSALQSASAVRDRLRVLDIVGACVPIDDADPRSCWVGAVAVGQLGEELRSAHPRVVHIPAEDPETLNRYRRRYEPLKDAEVYDVGEIFSAGRDGTSIEERITAAVARSLEMEPAEWPAARTWATKEFRRWGTFLRLPAKLDAYDGALLRTVRESFDGLPFVIANRGTAPATVLDSPDYFPLDRPDDPDLERRAVILDRNARKNLGAAHGTP